MDPEEKIIIAFIFKRSGKKELSYSEFYLTLSIGLNWFIPEEAKKFLDEAIEKKYLIKKIKQIKPAINIDEIIIPLGFSPSKKVFFEKHDAPGEEDYENIIDEIIKRILEKTNINKQQLFEKIQKEAKEKNLIDEVSALIVGMGYDINFRDLLEKINEKIFKFMVKPNIK
jgi:hypothetical protein